MPYDRLCIDIDLFKKIKSYCDFIKMLYVLSDKAINRNLPSPLTIGANAL